MSAHTPDAELEPGYEPRHGMLAERHTYDELVAMPHDELANHALGLETRIEGLKGLNTSLARFAQNQQSREEVMTREAEELTRAAETDPLTGLLNKRAWLERIEGLMQSGETNFAVVFADLSLFKTVNDIHGHERGDKILQRTAERLDDSFREGDRLSHDVARYGGDEFAVIFDLEARRNPELTEEKRVEAVIERMRTSFSDMVRDEGLGDLGFDIAIGYAICEDGDEVESLLKRADKNMYKDKFAGREKPTEEDIAALRSVRPILNKLGVRIPEDIEAHLREK